MKNRKSKRMSTTDEHLDVHLHRMHSFLSEVKIGERFPQHEPISSSLYIDIENLYLSLVQLICIRRSLDCGMPVHQESVVNEVRTAECGGDVHNQYRILVQHSEQQAHVIPTLFIVRIISGILRDMSRGYADVAPLLPPSQTLNNVGSLILQHCLEFTHGYLIFSRVGKQST